MDDRVYSLCLVRAFMAGIKCTSCTWRNLILRYLNNLAITFMFYVMSCSVINTIRNEIYVEATMRTVDFRLSYIVLYTCAL